MAYNQFGAKHVHSIDEATHLVAVLGLGIVALQLERGRQDSIWRPGRGVQVDLLHQLKALGGKKTEAT